MQPRRSGRFLTGPRPDYRWFFKSTRLPIFSNDQDVLLSTACLYIYKFHFESQKNNKYRIQKTKKKNESQKNNEIT